MSYDSTSRIYVSNVKGLLTALENIAELRKNGVMQPITIALAGGEYQLEKTIVIDECISAVTIEPISGELVTISGGRIIGGFKETEYNGVKCFGAFIPEVKSGEWSFTDLFVDGLRADLTRYPVTGGFHKTDIENHGTALFDGSTWFTAKPEDLNGVSNITDCIVSFCHFWIDEHSPIKAYDRETGKLTLEYKTRFNINGDIEYYLENVPQCFTEPNQWYLDRADGMVYYIPRNENQTPESITVRAPVISKLFEIKGDPEHDKKVENIRFRNLTFTCTRGDYASGLGVNGESDAIPYASDAQAVSNADGAISFYGAHCCMVEDCALVNFGVHGFVIKEGCDGIKLLHNKIYDGGAGGVKIIGSPSNGAECKRTHGNKISHNTINHCGRRYLSACGVLIMHSYENEISHNDISDLLYTGISCGWVWGYTQSVTRDNLITKNHIWNLGQGLLSDMGGVYLLGLQPGTIVSSNLIHDIKCRDYGGWALYTDEGSSFITLENNICYNCSDNCYHQHYGSMNTVRNNIFAFSGGELLRVSRTEEHLSIIFENNILYSNGSKLYGFSREHIEGGRIGTRSNIIWSTAGEPVMNGGWEGKSPLYLSDIQSMGMDEGSVVADPKFADAEHFDFSLPDDSVAYKHGFKPIDIGDVGVNGYKKTAKATRETFEWADMWWEHAEDFDSDRVLVIGDSITNGYRGRLQEVLKDKNILDKNILVDKYVGSRSVEDEAYFRELEYVLGEHQNYKYKVIHFNNGLHGGHLDGKKYEYGYRRAIKLIRSLHPEAILMLASSTPITPKGSEGSINAEANKSVIERNEIVKRLACEYLLPFDDSFEAVAGQAEYPQPDTVHFTQTGYDKLANTAALKICEYLK